MLIFFHLLFLCSCNWIGFLAINRMPLSYNHNKGAYPSSFAPYAPKIVDVPKIFEIGYLFVMEWFGWKFSSYFFF